MNGRLSLVLSKSCRYDLLVEVEDAERGADHERREVARARRRAGERELWGRRRTTRRTDGAASCEIERAMDDRKPVTRGVVRTRDVEMCE